MRTLFLIPLLFVAGCIPASQQDVLDLTNTVNQIVPLVREAVATSSEDTKDKIEIVLGQVEEVNKAVATAETPVEAIEKGWGATKDFNPYYGYGAFALGLIRLWQKKKESDTALEEVVVGVESAKKDLSLATLSSNLKSIESLVTRRKVAKIRKWSYISDS